MISDRCGFGDSFPIELGSDPRRVSECQSVRVSECQSVRVSELDRFWRLDARFSILVETNYLSSRASRASRGIYIKTVEFAKY